MEKINAYHGAILILGRSGKTANYEGYIRSGGFLAVTSLSPYHFEQYDGLLLPGGGDIEPAFFGQRNTSSTSVDTELDILQLQALDFFIRQKKPVLGICKGLQLINVYFGGSIKQALPEGSMHYPQVASTSATCPTKDTYHTVVAMSNTPFATWQTGECTVNSFHHQSILDLGKELQIGQQAPDGVIEAITHTFLPITAVQWHPERLNIGTASQAIQEKLLDHFLSQCASK